MASFIILTGEKANRRKMQSMRAQTPLELSNIHRDSGLSERVRAKSMVRVRGIIRHLYGDENYLELEK